jgi:hypothetical protein
VGNELNQGLTQDLQLMTMGTNNVCVKLGDVSVYCNAMILLRVVVAL